MAEMTTQLAVPQLDMLGSRPSEAQQALLKRMRQCFAQAEEFEAEMRREMLDDQRFRAGEQWSAREESARRAAGRPCLTVNTLPQYERQITNELRLNMPALTVLPMGNGADVQTAKTLKGIVRHIEQASHADEIRHRAFESAVRIGMGYYRLVLEYDDWMSFNQEPRLAGFRNPFRVYMDCGSQDPTGRDAEWAFVFEQCEKTRFQDEYNVTEREVQSWSSLASTGDTWIGRDQIRIAEYFWKEKHRFTLAQFQDGHVGLLEPLLLQPLEQLPNPAQVQKFIGDVLLTPRPRTAPLLPWMQQMVATAPNWLDGLPPQWVQMYAGWLAQVVGSVTQVRPTTYELVRWIKTNGYMILEESVWPGKSIPIIRVVGEELDMNNRVMRSGIVRYAKDPMRMENYWLTMQAEHIALSPVPPWLVQEGQIEGYEDMWARANRVPYPYLLYKGLNLHGQPAPPPMRNSFEPPIQAITVAQQTTQLYSQHAMGIHLTNIGAPNQKERSGKAIDARDRQADTGSYHYVDNLGQAMQYEGEQLVDLLPKVLSPGKIQRILGDDGSPQMVALFNSQAGQGAEHLEAIQGLAGVFDLGAGTYDVNVEVGPSYATKRQEASQNMRDVYQAAPQAMQQVLWKFVAMQDWEGADELAELIKKMPGQILEEPVGSSKDQQLAQLQQQIPQLMQQLQALDAFGKQAQGEIARLTEENKTLQAGHDLKVQELNVKADDTRIQAWAEIQKAAIERDKLSLEQQRERHAVVGHVATVRQELQAMQAMLDKLDADEADRAAQSTPSEGNSGGEGVQGASGQE